MSVYALVLGDSSVQLWGLTARQRLQRQLAELPECEIIESLAEVAAGGTVLCVRADFVFETRTLARLLDHPNSILCHEARPAAGVAAADAAAPLVEALENGVGGSFSTLQTSDLAAYEDNLRKAEQPLLLPVSEADRQALQDRLYGRSYKGITDLVTKWWWPRPAKVAVGWCARLGLTPNMVTLTGLLLVIYAGYAFYQGDY